MARTPARRHGPGGQGPARALITVAGEEMPIAVNWHAQARRFTLRLDPRTGGARLTMPIHADLDDAAAFIRRHEDWLARERSKADAPVVFLPGATIPVRGIDHQIRLARENGRRVWSERDGPTGPALLWVAGAPDMAAIRVESYLKAEARRDLEECARAHADRLGLKIARIAVRDQRTRWGSCSTSGVLSFSWRLVLAPSFVLDYVAAHEVAHLAEMNHGPRFWRLVKQTIPRPDQARAWLSRHGRGLHRYGSR